MQRAVLGKHRVTLWRAGVLQCLPNFGELQFFVRGDGAGKHIRI